MNEEDKSREELVQEADAARARLLETVDQLDQRRHEVLDPGLQIRKHARVLTAGGVVLAATVGGGVGLVLHHRSTASRRLWRERARLLSSLWRHPDRALHGMRDSLLGSVVRSVVASLIATAVTVPARRLLADLIDARLYPD